MKIDFSKVKKVKRGKNSTTIETHDGRSITIAHDKLNEDNRKGVDKYGKVSVKDTEDKRLGKVTVEDDEKETDTGDGDYGKVVRMAEGGSIGDQIAEGAIADIMKPVPRPAPISPDAQDRRDIYDTIVGKPTYDRFGNPSFDEGMDKVFGGGENGAPKDFQPEAFRQAVAQQTEDKVAKEAATQVDNSEKRAQYDKIVRDNEARVAAGLPPMLLPEGVGPMATPAPAAQQPQAAPADGGLAAASALPQDDDVSSLLKSGMNKQLAGINAQAKAEGDLGKVQADQLAAHVEADKQAMSAYEADRGKLMAEREALQQDIRDGQIDPERFWTGDPKTGAGGHSKIMTGIGMILAGFNPTNSPNAAINFLKYQMEQNLQAQAKNLSSKENLLSANLQQFGELRAATEMTRIQQNDMLNNQLQIAAANAKTPMAKAAALQAAGKLETENAQLFDKFAKSQATRNLLALAQTDPTKAPAALSALMATDPEKAKDFQARLVPGVGFATTSEGAQGIREMQATLATAKNSIDRLRAITNTGGKSLSPNLRAEADSLRTELIGRLRMPITGPGAMSDGERELLMKLVPDVTSITSLDSNTKTRLNTLEKRLTNAYETMAQSNGLKVPTSDKQAASEIKTVGGVQYQKVDGGWKRVK